MKTINCLDYLECQKKIEDKYHCELRGYAGKNVKTSDLILELLKKYPNIDYKAWRSKPFTEMNDEENAFRDEYDEIKGEYRDYWHCFLDMHGGITRNSMLDISFQEDLIEAQQRYGEDSWQAECASMFVETFGTEYQKILFDW